jgi:HEAT repeat protein
MVEKKYLLDDDAMQNFIVNGYVIVKPDLSVDFHSSVFQQTLALVEQGGSPGNDLLPKVPMLQQVFDHPTVVGALTSILGPNYAMHQHRACHYHPPGGVSQNLHKDYPVGGNVRCHRTRLAMAFYYPQDVTAEMGPTAIQPGTQYCMTHQPDAPDLPICGEAGTVTIVHYELWHRATENRSDKVRFMLKFLFCRTEEPTRPSWNSENPAWKIQPNSGIQHQTLWRHIWNWHRGQQNNKTDWTDSFDVPKSIDALRSADVSVRRNAADALSAVNEKSFGTIVPALRAAMNDPDEVVRLNAAYALGTIGEAAIPALMNALQEESEGAWERNLNRNDFTNPSQLDSPFGLAVVGESAVPALVDALADKDWWMRMAAATALGGMGRPAYVAMPALTEALRDESEWVRRNAADALGNIGQPPSEATATALVDAMCDRRAVSRWSLSDSPFRENAVAALARMGKPHQTAIPTLIDALKDDNEYIRSWAAIALRE